MRERSRRIALASKKIEIVQLQGLILEWAILISMPAILILVAADAAPHYTAPTWVTVLGWVLLITAGLLLIPFGLLHLKLDQIEEMQYD